jgi:hypothetical protein
VSKSWHVIPPNCPHRPCHFCGLEIYFAGNLPVSVEEHNTYAPTATTAGFGVNHFDTCKKIPRREGTKDAQAKIADLLGFEQLSLLPPEDK